MMASVVKRAGGYRLEFYFSGRRVLWLGLVSRKAAASAAGHIEALKAAAACAMTPPAAAIHWAASVGPRIKDRLVAIGLIASRPPADLVAYIAHYAATRDDWRPNTRRRWAATSRRLEATFGLSLLADITPGDAARAARAWRGSLAPSTAAKLVKDSRQLFAAAVGDRLLINNPFDGIKAAGAHIGAREVFVSAAFVRGLEAPAPWPALFCLARCAGLRIPSEAAAMRWVDIDFARSRLAVRAGKTSARSVPLAGHLLEALGRLFDAAPVGSTLVFPGLTAAACRRHLLKAIARTSAGPWPKLYQNLRAAARSDWEDKFPGHVVDYWLGHSATVGRKHYSRVSDSHFAQAAGLDV